MSESAKRGGEPREGVRGRGRKRRGDWRTKHLRACLLCGRVWRPGRRRTCPVCHVDRSICLTCDQVAVDDRARRCATDEALRRLVKACASDWERARRALDAARGDVPRALAPSRAPSGPGPRSASAGEVVDDALENDSTRVPGDAEKRPRGNPATRVPEVVGRGVDEVDAVTLPAPRRRPRPACDPRAPSADVRRCRTSSKPRSPARPRTRRPTRTDTQLRTSATAGRAPLAPPALFFGICAAVRGVPIALCRGYVTSHCDRICRDRISRAPRAAERLRSETEHDSGGDVPSVFSAVVELVEPLLDAEHAVHEGGPPSEASLSL